MYNNTAAVAGREAGWHIAVPREAFSAVIFAVSLSVRLLIRRPGDFQGPYLPRLLTMLCAYAQSTTFSSIFDG